MASDFPYSNIIPIQYTINAEPLYSELEIGEHNLVFQLATFIINDKESKDYKKYFTNIILLNKSDIENSIFRYILSDNQLDEEVTDILKSILLIFKPFKRNVLNFDKATSYTYEEFTKLLQIWKKENKIYYLNE